VSLGHWIADRNRHPRNPRCYRDFAECKLRKPVDRKNHIAIQNGRDSSFPLLVSLITPSQKQIYLFTGYKTSRFTRVPVPCRPDSDVPVPIPKRINPGCLVFGVLVLCHAVPPEGSMPGSAGSGEKHETKLIQHLGCRSPQLGTAQGALKTEELVRSYFVDHLPSTHNLLYTCVR
jgi:hypothetical protein